MEDPAVISGDLRSRTSALIRGRHDSLAMDVIGAIEGLNDSFGMDDRKGCAELLLRLFATSVEAGSLDTRSSAMRDLARYSPPLTTRQLFDAVHDGERIILDEIALDSRIGANAQPWTQVASAIRRAALDILGAYADQIAGRDAVVRVRDPLTTLIAAPVFELAIAQELERAHRHHHAVAVVLFDIDDLTRINREHGWGVGDRLLERTGILARQFFRTHDWVARHGDDSIGVLLPETTLDQAAQLAARFREMVQHRLILHDHKTDTTRSVTVSAAAVGTDVVKTVVEASVILLEAQAAVLRAKLNGRTRIESVALLPTSLTIFGAAHVLGQTPHEVANLIRRGTLKASRRGRHFHIDRESIENFRRAGR
jgi:diguanylate cyclase (GGDEF)-like protein